MQGWGTCGKAALGSPLSRFPSKITATPRRGAGAMIPHDAGWVPGELPLRSTEGDDPAVSAFRSFIGHFRQSLTSVRAVVKGRLGVNFNWGLIWLHLLLAERLKMRPGWPRLASSGVARSGESFNSVAFDCISLHSLSSMPWGFTRTLAWIPAFAGMTDRGPGMRGSRLSRERRSAFVVTTRTTNVRAGGATTQWAVVVRCTQGLASPLLSSLKGQL